MLEVDKAVSQAIRNGVSGAPISELVTDRSLSDVVEYLRDDKWRVEFVNGQIELRDSTKRFVCSIIWKNFENRRLV